MAIRSMALLMTIAVALGGRRGGFISAGGSLALAPGGNRAGNDEELGDSISLDTLDDAQDLSNTKAKQIPTNDAMCIQSSESISFPDKVGGKSCCGQTSNDPCPVSTEPKDKQTSHCRDDLSDGAFWVPRSGGRCYQFNKKSARSGATYIDFVTEEGKDVTFISQGRISTPDLAGKNVAVIGLKRTKCTASDSSDGITSTCVTFKSAVCLDCSSVAGTAGTGRRRSIIGSIYERKLKNKDTEDLYDKCVVHAFEDGFVKYDFILNNTSGNHEVEDDALKRCVAWIQIF